MKKKYEILVTGYGSVGLYRNDKLIGYTSRTAFDRVTLLTIVDLDDGDKITHTGVQMTMRLMG